jgi:2-polyprenyl-6-methoxyphenol hydroxylase-like FAD-dependent oxidoreductase
LISIHHWVGSRVFSIVRQNVISALASAAVRAGVEIATESAATGATGDGKLMLSGGRRVKADLIVGADGSNSLLRDSLGLLSKQRYLVDGCTRLLITKTGAERASAGDAATNRSHPARLLISHGEGGLCPLPAAASSGSAAGAIAVSEEICGHFVLSRYFAARKLTAPSTSSF